MEINLTKKEYEIKHGDIVFSNASEYHYMIVKVNTKNDSGYTLVCLEDAEVIHPTFCVISSLLSSYFSNGSYNVIPGSTLKLTSKSF